MYYSAAKRNLYQPHELSFMFQSRFLGGFLKSNFLCLADAEDTGEKQLQWGGKGQRWDRWVKLFAEVGVTVKQSMYSLARCLLC
jgi:hypothetical protein